MSLFQASVIKKYLNEQDKQPVIDAYKKYKSYFFNPVIQQNIRDSKEEQFQEGFLRELFVTIFGFIINPNPDYNLTTEYKNQTGSKKADGAILSPVRGSLKAIGVIELKSTKTKDLESIRQQAFDYKANQPECVYVITSNFEKLRFYINNAVEFEEFDLFNITPERFELLHLCLHYKNILSNLPLKIKEASVQQEAAITKKIYADYSLFKRELYQDLIAKNLNLPVFDGIEEKEIKLLLFKKSQKLLDRFLFIFFAEDKGLLPPNSIPQIIKQWEQLKDLDEYKPLYERYKKYFGYLNTGWKGKKYEIFGYNGGLFLPDEILDSITIDDELLKRHTNILSEYDFNTDVDVNILGHIFENSLNEIEEITARLEGQDVDSKKSKRKKDGVYYTPKYITKYIVDNTVGKLCEEKKTELGIIEEEYFKGRKARRKSTIKELDHKLKQYRDWLLQITICDPACGSGAFLNQALDFLIKEHHYIDELQAKLFEAPIVFQDIENTILENNLYGVDINEESVEIAKLSLWLRTAQKGRKLSTLSNNIKCGNSLIDDPKVAGEKAFNWKKEFSVILARGGFDVVIGNPPYVQSHSISESEKNFIYKNYKTAEYQINTYGIFVEKFINLLKENSYYSLIIPNYWLSTKFDKILRKEIFIDNYALEVINTYEVFENTTVDTLILTGQKIIGAKNSTSIMSISRNLKTISERLEAINLRNWNYSEQKQFSNGDEEQFLSFSNKLKLNGDFTLKDFLFFKKGMQPYEKGKGVPPQTREMMNDKVYHAKTKIDETYLPLLGARHIKRNYLVPFGEFIKYGKNLAAPRNQEIFKGDRILINRILSKNRIDGVLVSDTYVNNTDVFNLLPLTDCSINLKVLYALVTSKLCATYFKRTNVNLNRNAFPKINVNTLEAFPVPLIPKSKQESLTEQVNEIMISTSEFQNNLKKFLDLLKSKFEISSLSKKLKNWYELEFANFLKELKKAKVKLSLSEEAEWMQYFNKQKQKAQELKSEIDMIDKEIDKMVYKLYGLTEDEIRIVEDS